MKIRHLLLTSFVSAFLMVCIFGVGLMVYAHTQNWNASYQTSPADGDNISAGAGKIRDLKRDIQERIDLDHYFDLAGTQADQGQHEKVTLRVGAAPTAIANIGILAAIDVDTKAELHYIDEDSNEVQLTSGGALNVTIDGFASGTKMFFYQSSCPAGWTDANVDDVVLATTGGSDAYNVAGGNTAGTWTQPNHVHTGPEHNHQWYDFNGGSVDLMARSGGAGDGTWQSNGSSVQSITASADYYTKDGGTGTTGSGATAATYRPEAAVGLLCTKD